MAESFLEESSGSEQVRKAMESELGYDEEVWRRIGAEPGRTTVMRDARAAEAGEQAVITSYSIHYTKLYEGAVEGSAEEDRRGRNNFV